MFDYFTGLPFRGCHGNESDSNFIQLLKLRSEDDKCISHRMKKKTKKYPAPDKQNQIIKIMSHSVLQKIAAPLQSTKCLAIMVDETTHVSNKEQVGVVSLG